MDMTDHDPTTKPTPPIPETWRTNPALMKTVFRNGDIVKVVNPLIFIRCGYPHTLAEETKIVIEDFGSKITDLFRECGGPVDERFRQFKRVASEIAHARLKSKGFGGRKRQVYTKEDLSIAGREFVVVEKKVVKTGIYYSPSGSGEDWEPGGLDNCETHVIVKIADPDSVIRCHDGSLVTHSFSVGKSFWIESTSIVKAEKGAD
jgi:hypothetical protein